MFYSAHKIPRIWAIIGKRTIEDIDEEACNYCEVIAFENETPLLCNLKEINGEKFITEDDCMRLSGCKSHEIPILSIVKTLKERLK